MNHRGQRPKVGRSFGLELPLITAYNGTVRESDPV